MKIKVERKALRGALDLLLTSYSAIGGNKASTCVLIEVDNMRVKMTTSDVETMTVVEVSDVVIEEIGDALIDFKKLDGVASLSGKTVIIETKDSKVILRSVRGIWRFFCVDVKQFKHLDISGEKSISEYKLGVGGLTEGYNFVHKNIGKDELRPDFEIVRISGAEQMAMSNRKLFVAKVGLNEPNFAKKDIRESVLGRLLRAFSKGEINTVEISEYDKGFKFQYGVAVTWVRKLGVKFPEQQAIKLIEESNLQGQVELDKFDFKEAIDGAMIIGPNFVTINSNEKGVEILVEVSSGEKATMELEPKMQEGFFSVKVFGEDLRDWLSVAPGGEVKLVIGKLGTVKVAKLYSGNFEGYLAGANEV